MSAVCPGCGSRHTDRLHRWRAVPVSNCLVYENRQDAVDVARGDIDLHACPVCLLIFNAAFRPDQVRYESGYEESQAYSSTFSSYQDALIAELVERHGLHGRTVLEIGCGKGDFLAKICRAGGNRGIGFDPTFDPERMAADDHTIVFIRDFFSSRHQHVEADFFCSLMTLEHICGVGDFLSLLRRSMGENEGRVLFLQVPNVARILERHAFEDIYYEHCSYFCAESLRRLLLWHGFQVDAISERYDRQYLSAEARPASHPSARPGFPAPDPDWCAALAGFPAGLTENLERWSERFRRLRSEGKRTVLWGGGSKAAAILDLVDEADEIRYVVDINPFRQENYLPGSGVQVKPPAFLLSYRPDVVVVVNPIYRDEVAAALERLELSCELL